MGVDMTRIILNVKNMENGLLSYRAARHLIDNPDKIDAVLEYGEGIATMYVKRGKGSIIVMEASA